MGVMNKEIKLSSKVHGRLNSIACKPGRVCVCVLSSRINRYTLA